MGKVRVLRSFTNPRATGVCCLRCALISLPVPRPLARLATAKLLPFCSLARLATAKLLPLLPPSTTPRSARQQGTHAAFPTEQHRARRMSNPASPPRRLVLFDSVGCAPPRVMLAPAGAHLPPGVRPVVALAIVSDHRRGGDHAGAAGFTTLTLTAGVAARGPCLGEVQPIVAPNCRTGRRLATECHGFADARTSGALGLAPPSFAAPGTYLGASAVRVVAANRGAGRRLATECHGVADAARYVRTAGGLGLG
jgi:hypothetical protein